MKFESKEIIESIEKACKSSSNRLDDSIVDSFNSGSTCTGVLLVGPAIYSINIGDSRTVLGKLYREELRSEVLTKDQIPTREDEKKRIISHGGRVHQFRGTLNYELSFKMKMELQLVQRESGLPKNKFLV